MEVRDARHSEGAIFGYECVFQDDRYFGGTHSGGECLGSDGRLKRGGHQHGNDAEPDSSGRTGRDTADRLNDHHAAQSGTDRESRTNIGAGTGSGDRQIASFNSLGVES